MYGAAFLLLPVDKLAAITLQSVMSTIIKSPTGVDISPLAMDIGKSIEAEVNVLKFTKGKKGMTVWEKELIKSCSGSKPFHAMNKIKDLLKEDSWSEPMRAKVGSALIYFVVQSAKLEDGRPAFFHKKFYSPFLGKRLSVLEVDPDVMVKLSKTDTIFGSPPYYPMLVPPKPWNNAKNDGGYFRLKPGLMRTKSKTQGNALRNADIPEILEALNFLGNVPWRINSRVLDIMTKLWERGEVIGEIPSKLDITMPTRDEVAEALRKSKKAYNKNKDSGEDKQESLKESEADELSSSSDQVNNDREYSKIKARIKMKNCDLHSLRCDLKLKLSIAEKFRDEIFYFPSNLDFRGRAYPVPPNLSHLGSDLCRGLLLFDEAKPLGKNGIQWLKIHLSNLFGNNKISLEERVDWADMHMDDIRDSAFSPIDGARWWANRQGFGRASGAN
jgi:DNA-directed RNA polymerase